jgi:hypothetical protein
VRRKGAAIAPLSFLLSDAGAAALLVCVSGSGKRGRGGGGKLRSSWAAVVASQPAPTRRCSQERCPQQHCVQRSNLQGKGEKKNKQREEAGEKLTKAADVEALGR